MSLQVMAPSSYPVEMSGWDVDENFFVEETDLEWTEDEKTVHLQLPVRNGTVVFLRLMGIDSQENAFPVAYRATDVRYRTEERRWDVSLMQMMPRALNDASAETSHKQEDGYGLSRI